MAIRALLVTISLILQVVSGAAAATVFVAGDSTAAHFEPSAKKQGYYFSDISFPSPYTRTSYVYIMLISFTVQLGSQTRHLCLGTSQQHGAFRTIVEVVYLRGCMG